MSKTYGVPVVRPHLKGPDDRMITRAEAAALLSVSISKVDDLTRKGMFRTYYQGSMIRFLRSEVVGCFEAPDVNNERMKNEIMK